MSDSPVALNLDFDAIDKFNRNMQDLYYTARPEYEECLLRCKILNLINDIWQKHLYQNELDAMHDEHNNRYREIITNKTYVELESVPNPKHYNKPYKRYGPSSTTKSKPKPNLNADSNSNDDTTTLTNDSDNNDNNESENDKSSKDDIFSGSEEKIRESASSAASSSSDSKSDDNDNDKDKDDDELFNHWCTPVEGEQKVIIIREYEGGPIIKRVIIPSVMIFGSIAFGLDGYGSDIDIALPASISSYLFLSFYFCLHHISDLQYACNVNSISVIFIIHPCTQIL